MGNFHQAGHAIRDGRRFANYGASRHINSYLESVTVIPASTAAGAVTILDGSTNIVVIPTLAGTGTGTQVQVPYTVQLGIRATSASTGFKITTGAAVSVIAVGRFTA
jgi:hypothetical protein